MKSTIKIDAVTSLVIEPVGTRLLISVTTCGIVVFQKAVPPNIVDALASALSMASQATER